MARSHLRGHEIEYLDGRWVYSDTKESTENTWDKRSCGNCGLGNTDEGHDGCLGTLKGAMNACCGHGHIDEAYVQFLDGSVIRSEDAVTIMDVLKRHK